MTITRRAVPAAGALLAAALVGACGTTSAPSSFYRLAALNAASPPASAAPRLVVGPVSVPDYLDRPQIVSRAGPYQLTVNEFHRWAGSLREEVSLSVVDNLSALLVNARVSAYGEGAALDDALQLRIDVHRLEGSGDGQALLDARWRLLADDGREERLARRTRIAVPAAGGEPAALVAAYSQAVEAFSREVADVIRDQLR